MRMCFLAFTVFVFLAVISAVLFLDNGFRSIDVETVRISDIGFDICGLLYRPCEASSNNPLPAVVLVHGISSSKESMSSIALELARNGFVALTIDAVGHGDSGGRLWATSDPSLGALAALRFLESQPYVDASSLGVVGHSLGAGAARATANAHRRVEATVLIGGGLGGVASDSAYGVLNSTFPKNLMVAIGRQDVLFDISKVTKGELPQVFGVSQEVVPSVLYGDFSSGNARMLITPATTHLLEPLDPLIVSETVRWMINALKQDKAETEYINLVYPYREALMLVSVIFFVSLTFPISLLAFQRDLKKREEHGFLDSWKIALIWGVLSLVLLAPLFPLGFVLNFPPVLFGSAIAWWLLTVGVAGLLLIMLVLPRFSVKLSMRKVVKEPFTLRGFLIALGMFLLLYFTAWLMGLLGIRFWVFVSIFKTLSVSRIALLPMFIPFFLVFFYVEGIFLHILRKQGGRKRLLSELLDMCKTIMIKIAPYVMIMVIQYAPMFLLDFKPLSSIAGFMVEFLPLLTFQFIMSTACSWWLHRVSSSIGVGAVFNALMFAWISAGVFPFGVFR